MKNVFELVFWMVGIFVLLAGIYGYFANLVDFIQMVGGPISALFIGRVIGLFVPFIGAILGYM